jgi:hypothetical protein
MGYEKLELFRGLIGLEVGHVWHGYGSALFLEFGRLRSRMKRDGSEGPPEGEMGLMIEWSWRIERRMSIACGSFSAEAKQQRTFGLLRNKTVTTLSVFGRLPEIEIGLCNGMHVLSFMTAEGSPAWTLFDRRQMKAQWLHVERGRLRVQSA